MCNYDIIHLLKQSECYFFTTYYRKGKIFMGYLPLDFLNNQESPNMFWETEKNWMSEDGWINADTKEDAFLKFCMSPDFMRPAYKGEFSILNSKLIKNLDMLSVVTSQPVKRLIENPRVAITEWKDMIIAGIIMDKWGRNKQVYKLDEEFANALYSTEKMQLSKENLKHLPTNTFYVDLSACNGFNPIHGAVVHVNVTETYAAVAIYMLRYDSIFFSWYIYIEFDENGLGIINRKDVPDDTVEIYSPILVRDVKNAPKVTHSTMRRADIVMLCLQMMCYITSKEPDIKENENTKKTYRKPTVIKNKFSEVQQYDVGVVFGKSIKTQIKQLEKEAQTEVELHRSEGKKHVSHKSPKPHFRCAHWQHYHTGKGRTQLELKWIQPTFVGFGTGSDTNSNVVIHKIVS